MPEREKNRDIKTRQSTKVNHHRNQDILDFNELGFPKSVPAPPNDKPPNSPSLPEAILNPESLEVLKELMEDLKF